MKVKFLTPVQHNLDDFQPGDTADLPQDAARALVQCGAAEEVTSLRSKAQAEAAEKAAAEKLAAEKADAEKLAATLQRTGS